MSSSMPQSRRARRLLDLALALLILLLGIGTVVVVSEQSRDVSARDSMVTIDDVAVALRGRGLEVAITGRMADVPGIAVSGHIVQVNNETITVVLFESVADRVVAEQQYIATQRLFTVDPDNVDPDNQEEMPRLVSVANALVLHTILDGPLVQPLTAAISDIPVNMQ